MKITAKRSAFTLFLIWEGWWLYIFLTRPIPDAAMQSIAAIFFGVVLPLVVLFIYLLASFAWRHISNLTQK